MEMIDIQDQFAALLARSLKVPWDEIQVHYENAKIDEFNREVFTSWRLLDGVKHEIRPSLESIDLLAELQKHKPQGQSDTWLWLEFSIDRKGKYRFDYKYDNPPLIMEQIRYANMEPKK